MLSTKIICTIGPESDSTKILSELADAGMNVARLNFSHGDHKTHLKIIEKIKKINNNRKFPIAILLDTKGPEIRTGNQEIKLTKGKNIFVNSPPHDEKDNSIFVNYSYLHEDLEVGDSISLDGGLFSLTVLKKEKNNLNCKVVHGGILKARRHVNLPGKNIKLPGVTLEDENDILFGLKNKVNIIALSFVRNAETLKKVRKILGNEGNHIKLIAKIENQEGVDNLEEIVQEADGIMVARGDLGIEVEMEELPQIQRRIAYQCAKYGKRLIVATQILESMIENPVPTRAEVTDVANAVFEQTDAIMLSGETSIGKYPVICVKTLSKIVRRSEEFPGVNFSEKMVKVKIGEHLAESAIQIAKSLNIRAIVVITRNGRGARYLSNFRPYSLDIFSFTNSINVLTSMALYRGVFPFLMEFQINPEETIQDALKILSKRKGFVSNEKVVVLANILTGEGYSTSLQVRSIPK